MPKYLIVRQFEVGQAEMPNVGRKSRKLVEEEFPQITWEYSHVTINDSGLVKTFCVYDGPNEEMVREHAAELGLHDLEGIHEIVGDVTPADFPL